MTRSNPSEQPWRKALLASDASLQQAISCLNESTSQIVLVVSADERLIGTLTDGDIRRGLLRGLGLDSPVDSLINHDPLVVPPELGRDAVLQLMRANRVHQLPVVDTDRHVVGLHLLDELMAPRRRRNLMVIMAGGQGTRLRPHTENCPKPLLPVGGKPMLEHIIERAKSDGFGHFVLSIHYLGHMIEEYFGDGSRWGVSIEYLREDSPLGTAGAISLLNPRPELPFVVSNGDVLTDIHYGELLDFHCRHAASATMAVRLHEWQHPFGVVRTDGVDIVGFEEKPISRSHINAGVYVLEPAALGLLKRAEHCDMPTLFARLKEEAARTIVYPMHEPWLDVGRDDDLKRARAAHPRAEGQ
ncbi:nucleotidyl transferase [Parazoarcus communis]|uniref:Nucleotidyl transferase n=1 Tax=Parazoarcus communis TaxID=41977 RepID=A0A2U8GU51_9RHOO|nr:nucleotidyltransferase family protein [Parazoarcus communis]AWI77212.1 nucleotidyl transferase [Parazoarcus communis]